MNMVSPSWFCLQVIFVDSLNIEFAGNSLFAYQRCF